MEQRGQFQDLKVCSFLPADAETELVDPLGMIPIVAAPRMTEVEAAPKEPVEGMFDDAGESRIFCDYPSRLYLLFFCPGRAGCAIIAFNRKIFIVRIQRVRIFASLRGRSEWAIIHPFRWTDSSTRL
jgi:hypothetical protein